MLTPEAQREHPLQKGEPGLDKKQWIKPRSKPRKTKIRFTAVHPGRHHRWWGVSSYRLGQSHSLVLPFAAHVA